MLTGTGARFAAAAEGAVLEQAHRLRNEIVSGITDQAPGGRSLAEPSELTLARRRLLGFRGTKSLLVRADLRNSVSVIKRGDTVFVGIARSAKSRDDEDLVDIASVQEFGSNPIVIPITPAMRRFLGALFREAGRTPEPGAGSGAGVVVVQVPARPFLRPAMAAFSRDLDAKLAASVLRRFLNGGPRGV